MIAAHVYPSFARALLSRPVDLLRDPPWVALVVGPFDPGHRTITDVREASGAGYKKGGKRLANLRVEQDSDGPASVLADDAVWPSSSVEAVGAVVYLPSGDLAVYHGFGPLESRDGEFRVRWHQGVVLVLG